MIETILEPERIARSYRSVVLKHFKDMIIASTNQNGDTMQTISNRVLVVDIEIAKDFTVLILDEIVRLGVDLRPIEDVLKEYGYL